MSSRPVKLISGSVLLVAACFGAAWSFGYWQAAGTRPVEQLLPAGSVLYLGWDGGEAHRPAWEKTAAYESLEKTGVFDLLRKVVLFAAVQAGQDEAQAAKILDHISDHGLSVALALPPGAGPPLPQLVIVLHEAAELEPHLGGVAKQALGRELRFESRRVDSRNVTATVVPNSPNVEVGWWSEGNHLVVAAGIGSVKAAVDVAAGRSANITTDALWKKYRAAPADFEVSSVAWFNLGGIRQKFAAMPLPVPTAGPPPTVGKILDVLGLGNVGALATQSGFKGRALWSTTILEMPSPRSGLFSYADYQPMTLADLPPLPAGTSGFYASRMDFSQYYDGLVTTARSAAAVAAPEMATMIDGLLAQGTQLIGFDLKEKLLDPLGNVVCLYADPAQGSFLGFGGGIAIKVDDEKTLRATADDLLAKLAAQLNVPATIRAVKKQGHEIFMVEFGAVPIVPAFAIDNGWLVFGLGAQTVEAFYLRMDGRLPRWTPNEEHRAGLAELPGQFTAISVSDPRSSIQGLLGFAPMVISMAQLTMSQMPMSREPVRFPISAADIPPAELVARPLFPNLAVFVADDEGFHWKSRRSIPSIPFVGGASGGSGVATSGVLIALLLPAVQQAREAARRASSKNNLKQIGLALHNYHDVHLHFPAGTHPNDQLEVEKRLSWMAEILPFIDQKPLFELIDFNKAWDDEANQELMKTPLMVYQNPGTIDDSDSEYATTHYVGIAGVGEDAPNLPVTSKKAGVFGYNRETRIRDIKDGTSNTIAVSEAHDSIGPWGAGGKPTIRALTEQPYINGPDGIGSFFAGGCNVLFADGSVRFISENIDPKIMESLSTIAGGDPVGDF